MSGINAFGDSDRLRLPAGLRELRNVLQQPFLETWNHPLRT
jgi:hypothetical protein